MSEQVLCSSVCAQLQVRDWRAEWGQASVCHTAILCWSLGINRRINRPGNGQSIQRPLIAIRCSSTAEVVKGEPLLPLVCELFHLCWPSVPTYCFLLAWLASPIDLCKNVHTHRVKWPFRLT